MSTGLLSRDAEYLRQLAQLARVRNARLAIDWVSRRQKPRWRMLPLDSQFFDRQRLRDLVRAKPVVPSTLRRLTPPEIEAAFDPNPWRLYPPRLKTPQGTAASAAAASAAASNARKNAAASRGSRRSRV